MRLDIGTHVQVVMRSSLLIEGKVLSWKEDDHCIISMDNKKITHFSNPDADILLIQEVLEHVEVDVEEMTGPLTDGDAATENVDNQEMDSDGTDSILPYCDYDDGPILATALHEEWMKNPEYKKEYEALEYEFQEEHDRIKSECSEKFQPTEEQLWDIENTIFNMQKSGYSIEFTSSVSELARVDYNIYYLMGVWHNDQSTRDIIANKLREAIDIYREAHLKEHLDEWYGKEPSDEDPSVDSGDDPKIMHNVFEMAADLYEAGAMEGAIFHEFKQMCDQEPVDPTEPISLMQLGLAMIDAEFERMWGEVNEDSVIDISEDELIDIVIPNNKLEIKFVEPEDVAEIDLKNKKIAELKILQNQLERKEIANSLWKEVKEVRPVKYEYPGFFKKQGA